MIHWGEGSNNDNLWKLGINLLTGEACGLGMRVLCDITEAGRRLLTEILGVVEITPAGQWNGREGTVGSVMIPRDLFRTILVFGLLKNPKVRYVYVCSDGLYAPEDEDEEERIKDMDWLKVETCVRKRGTAPGGMRNRHEFTGRVA